jgi:glycosyl transferase, family 25
MISYKIYYLNLDKSTERKTFMEAQFKKFNQPVTRFSATYGKELDPVLLKKTKKQHNILAHFPFPNDGEIGICFSYFNLWKTISVQQEDFAIVLEDDALVKEDFFSDLETILSKITIEDFVDISGRKGFMCLDKNEWLQTFLMPGLQTTGQIIGKNAAKKLDQFLGSYYAPIDVMKQDVYKHQVAVFTTTKSYVSSNDKNVGGTTIQQKNLPKVNKIIREILRPIWQLIALFTMKFYRCVRNYQFYKSHKKAIKN